MKTKTLSLLMTFALLSSTAAQALPTGEPIQSETGAFDLAALQVPALGELQRSAAVTEGAFIQVKDEHRSSGGGSSRPSSPAPSHSAPSHSAPSHSAPSHSAPSHSAPSHSAPSHSAPSHTPSHTPRTEPRQEHKAPAPVHTPAPRTEPRQEHKAPAPVHTPAPRTEPRQEHKAPAPVHTPAPRTEPRQEHKAPSTLPPSTVTPSRPGSVPGGTHTAPPHQTRPGSVPGSQPQQRSPVVHKEPITHPNGAHGTRETRANGGSTERVTHPNGSRETISRRVDPRTGHTSTTSVTRQPNGTTVTRHANGIQTERHRNGDVVRIGADGHSRTTINRTVVNGGNRVVVRQTTIINNRTVVVNRDYNRYSYRGSYYYRYAPVYNPWWGPAYYPFYYNPWARPYYYPWGWYPVGYYSWYYTPYSYYPSAAFWLTDFIIRDAIMVNQLNAVKEEQRAGDAARQAAISEETKAQIKIQVEAAMQDYKAKKEPELAPALNPKHIFVIHDEISAGIIGADGEVTEETCDLSAGDLVKLAAQPEQDAQAAQMKVVSAKGSCEVGSVVNVSMTDLQEMLNEFSHRLEKGIEKMKDEKEKGALSESGNAGSTIRP